MKKTIATLSLLLTFFTYADVNVSVYYPHPENRRIDYKIKSIELEKMSYSPEETPYIRLIAEESGNILRLDKKDLASFDMDFKETFDSLLKHISSDSVIDIDAVFDNSVFMNVRTFTVTPEKGSNESED